MPKIDADFLDGESVIRATRKFEYGIDSNGRHFLSSGPLKDPKGTSVNRTYKRTIEEAVIHLRQKLNRYQNVFFSITVSCCRETTAYLMYDPTEKDEYHCTIWGDDKKSTVNEIQALKIAECAQLVSIEINPII